MRKALVRNPRPSLLNLSHSPPPSYDSRNHICTHDAPSSAYNDSPLYFIQLHIKGSLVIPTILYHASSVVVVVFGSLLAPQQID